MDISKRLKALKLSSSDSSFSKKVKEVPILDFPWGNAFTEHVVPFLSLDDLINGSASCRQMNSMCRAYTVGEVLVLHSMGSTSSTHKIELGKLIMGFVSRTYTGNYDRHYNRHRRFIRNEGESFWARLYHPSTLPEMLLAMTAYFNRHGIKFDTGMSEFDWDANTNKATPILVSAMYGLVYGCVRNGCTDVTIILRYLLMNQGNKHLILKSPINGPRFWYNYLFGDPCYRTKKMLLIKIRFEGCNETRTLEFGEDENVAMNLRAARPREE